MVGGDVAAFERARPVFESAGNLVVHLGAVGAGLAAKLARNLAGYVTMSAVQEGLRLAAATGVDRATFDRILEHTGTLSPMMHKLLEVEGGDAAYSAGLEPLIAIAEKDLRAALELAADLDVELPVTAVTTDHIAEAYGLERR